MVVAHRESTTGLKSPTTLSVTSVAEMALVSPRAVADTTKVGHPAVDTEHKDDRDESQ